MTVLYLDSDFVDFLVRLLHDEIHHLLDLAVGISFVGHVYELLNYTKGKR